MRTPIPFRLALLLGLLLSAPARAGSIHDFDDAMFAAAQQQGGRIMVVISSRWDPDAQEQQFLLNRISRDIRYPDVVVLRADFARRKDLLRELGATQEDTVIVFHGSEERARSVGKVEEFQLRHMLDMAK
jgi:hypothetical protein